MYTLFVKSGIIKRDSDGKQIVPSMNPANPNGQDQQEYMEWLRQGGVATQDMRNPDEVLIADAKAGRDHLLSTLKMSASSGRVYDVDLESQTRIASAITTMEPKELTDWVLADNSVASVSREELREVLRNARIKTTTLWIIPEPSKLTGGV